MTREDIIRMAMEAGLYSGNPRTPGTAKMIEGRIERFAALVAAAEREACAKVCEDDVLAWSYPGSITRSECAAAIRKRGEVKP